MVNSVCGKRRFYSRLAAKRALKDCKRKRRGEQKIYKCPKCNLWHLTSQTPDWRK